MRPKRVKLGLSTYPITFVEGVIEDDGKQLSGRICHHHGERGIAVSLTHTDDIGDTLLHEVLHGIFMDRQLGDLCHSETSEELLIGSLSRGLLAALRDNKGLADYILKPE